MKTILISLLLASALSAQPFPFSAPVAGPVSALAGAGAAVSVGDLNGDGRDEIFSEGGNTVVWSIAGPGGVYGPPQTYIFPQGPLADFSVQAVGDVTDDGNADLVLLLGFIGAMTPNFVVLPGDGTGQFGAPIVLPPIQFPFIRAAGFIAEIDASNNCDELVLIESDLSSLVHRVRTYSWDPVSSSLVQIGLLNTTFQNSVLVGAIRGSVPDIGDVNGDGLPDIVSSVRQGSASPVIPTHLMIVPGIAAPPFFGAPVLIPKPTTTVFSGPVFVGDLNLDGLSDVLFPDADSTGLNVQWYVAFGDAQTLVGPWVSGSPWPVSPPGTNGTIFRALVDVDEDGFPDLIATRNPNPFPLNFPLDMRFMRGNGQGLFGDFLEFSPTPPGTGAPILADADGDGDIDLVHTFTATTTVYHNESLIGMGTAPAGTSSVPTLQRGIASPGSTSFHLTVNNAPPNTACIIGISTAPVNPAASAGVAIDVNALIWPLGMFGPVVTDPLGAARFPIGLPATGLAGVELYVQWAIADSGPGPGYVLSQGGKIVIW